ncbi:MAG: hypothetical protein LBP76_05735 [Treponema sp.]|jgi:hypothetical protein|nr:hypothetical protein [Treponema sp.]
MTEILSAIADVATIIGVIGVISAIIALVMTKRQMTNAARTLGLNLVASTLHEFSTNERLKKLYYEKFEYVDEAYLPTHEFFGTSIERDMDSLLMLFSVPALAWENGQLKTEDMLPLEYYICRIAESKTMQEYLRWLETWLKSQNISRHPYLSFCNLAEELIKQKPNLLADKYRLCLRDHW